MCMEKPNPHYQKLLGGAGELHDWVRKRTLLRGSLLVLAWSSFKYHPLWSKFIPSACTTPAMQMSASVVYNLVSCHMFNKLAFNHAYSIFILGQRDTCKYATANNTTKTRVNSVDGLVPKFLYLYMFSAFFFHKVILLGLNRHENLYNGTYVYEVSLSWSHPHETTSKCDTCASIQAYSTLANKGSSFASSCNGVPLNAFI